MLRRVIDTDSASRCNPRVHAYLLQAVEKQYAEGNEKLYLKQKYDTTALFALTKKLFDVAETLDSIEAQPDEKGRVKTKYRTRNAEMLNTFRPNLFFGGTYHIRKGNYADAFVMFDTYLDCAFKPMFGAYDYMSSDNRMPEAAYWAAYAGSKLNNPEMVLKYAELAETDTTKLNYMLMYEALAYNKLGDREKYESTLIRGFKLYPLLSFFFPHLVDFYNNSGEYDKTNALCDEALKIAPDSILFLYAKSNVLLTIGGNDECIDVTKRIIELNDSIAEPYYNIGMAYLNKVVELERGGQRQDKAQIKRLYTEAMPYLEKYRALAPNEQKKWAPALYRVYLNLNKGRQFDDIDKIIGNEKP
ncbi:MAG: tetratricopeptide repeat protein [Prevotella sp.]